MRNKKLKISYNNYQPYFSVENNRIDKTTIEGFAFQSLIDKNNLTPEFINENFKWGNQDENGRFNGIIGRVLHR